MQHNITKLVQEIAKKLSSIYDNEVSQQQVAWWLLEKLTEKSKTKLISQKTIDISYIQEKRLNDWIAQHVKEKKPLQYILGSVPFVELTINVRPSILIPRSETEEWTFNLVKQLNTLENKHLTILDVGTGSGCIALALAKALPEATVYASDIFEQTLNLTRENKKLNNISNVKLILSDVYDQIPRNLFFDLIVSNPPYISPKEWKTLSSSITQWEDKQALVAPDDGLAVILKIIAGAKKILKKNPEMEEKNIPQLVLEIGYTQAESVTQLMKRAGFEHVDTRQDLSGKDRVVTGRLT